MVCVAFYRAGRIPTVLQHPPDLRTPLPYPGEPRTGLTLRLPSKGDGTGEPSS